MRIVSERIRRVRESQGWTQETLAEKAGISRSTLANYELGRREPDLSALHSISRATGVSIAYLVGETDDPTPLREWQKPSRLFSRITQLANSLEVTLRDVCNQAGVTEAQIRGLDPVSPDPHTLWPIAQVLGTSMAYLVGDTDRTKTIIGRGQAAHDQSRLYRPADDIDPEDAWDLERAWLEVRRQREEERRIKEDQGKK